MFFARLFSIISALFLLSVDAAIAARNATITTSSDLSFGTLVAPTSSTANYTLSPSSCAIVTPSGNGAVSLGGSSCGVFSVTTSGGNANDLLSVVITHSISGLPTGSSITYQGLYNGTTQSIPVNSTTYFLAIRNGTGNLTIGATLNAIEPTDNFTISGSIAVTVTYIRN